MKKSLAILLALVVCLVSSHMARGAVRISEFAASNLRGISDEDGNHEDWIEIFNDGAAPVSLQNWCLTDTPMSLDKWRFPATNIGPGQFLIVFASGKDRRIPGRTLHTNFKLNSDGDYLALVEPDARTVATQFSPAFPPQAVDASYGFPMQTARTVLSQGAPVKWKVWTTATAYVLESSGWKSSLTYAATGWSNGTSGLGWDDTASPMSFSPWFGTNSNPRSLMPGSARALFSRFLFKATNVVAASELRLRMRFDDGFVAWLNGTLVASNLAPAFPSWNSVSTGLRDDVLNGAWATFPMPLASLVEGTNLLAIQVFNTSAPDTSDLLLLPEVDLMFPGASDIPAYFSPSTPGKTNGSGTVALAPGVEMLSSVARPPGGAGSPPLTITALVSRTVHAITNVTLFHRTMFGTDSVVGMVPGTGGVWTASIPTTALGPGQMLRWRIEARDAAGNIGTGPPFVAANDDDRYYGTVALNPAELDSRLPIVHWFVQDYAAAASETGGRSSCYFLNHFYDNLLVKLHGQSTSGFPKKGHDFDFNAGNRFIWREGEKGEKDVNLLTNWGDKSKVRNTLAYEMLNRSGVLSHWAFPVRVQTNGGFHAVLDMVEDGDDCFTERVGLDPRGALYKVYTAAYTGGVTGTNIWVAEKKARKDEDSSDLAAFSAGIAANWSLAQRRAFVYDNVDLGATINYLASIVLSGCHDQGHKNFYLYRDSDGTRLWRVLPWDVDLTFGHEWFQGPAYFEDNIYFDQPLQLGVINTLKEIIFGSAELNQMFLRRLRTLMDNVLQPGTTPLSLRTNENRVAELLDLIDPPGVATTDARLDFVKWGWWTNGTQIISSNASQEIRPQARRITYTFFTGRRAFLQAGQTSSGIAIPSSQSAGIGVTLEMGDYNPAGGSQEQEYVVLRNRNSVAVDVSGWKLSGQIGYEFPPGTVIPSGGGITGNIGLLFVARNPWAFRQRAIAPKGGQNCLLAGPYSGQLSARGGSLVLEDAAHRVVASVSYAGAPSAVQQFLRVTELMFNPSPLAGSTNRAQEFEFIELRNISPGVTLDLKGVHFTNGLTFAFTNTTLLAPRQSIVIPRNPAAFVERYGTGFNIAGACDGFLEDGGQRITLLDSANEEILDFTYGGAWNPLADGLGFSLVVVDEQAVPGAWTHPSQWRASATRGGSPGREDPVPNLPPIRINEVLAHTDPPQVDSIELYNPTTNSVGIGGWFLTDDPAIPGKYRIPDNTRIGPLGYLVFDERQFNSQPVATNNFRISSTGDDIWLFSGDASTNLTGYAAGIVLGASPNGSSFGFHTASDGSTHFVLQRGLTLGSANAGPLVGPMIIRSIMYHPPDIVLNNIAADDDTNEYIELLNTGTTNVGLFHPETPVNTWRLAEGISYSFPTNCNVAPGSNLLVVGFSPTNTVLRSAFYLRWPWATNIPLFGPWSGKLDNSAETVCLQRPDTTNLDGTVPFITVEQVQYRDESPWPLGADGWGASLQRKAHGGFADDPGNWVGLPPPGSVPPDLDRDGMEDWWEVQNGLNPAVQDGAGDPDGDGITNIAEFYARTDPRDSGSTFRLQVSQRDHGTVVLQFEGRPQLNYWVQTNGTPDATGWQTWLQIPSALTNRTLTITNTGGEGTRFYLLRAGMSQVP